MGHLEYGFCFNVRIRARVRVKTVKLNYLVHDQLMLRMFELKSAGGGRRSSNFNLNPSYIFSHIRVRISETAFSAPFIVWVKFMITYL